MASINNQITLIWKRVKNSESLENSQTPPRVSMKVEVKEEETLWPVNSFEIIWHFITHKHASLKIN